MTHTKILTLTAALLVAAVAPVRGLAPEPRDVTMLVEMPLAVTTVVDYGVPESEVERVVVTLNEADVPVAHSVEVVRYTPFGLVVDDADPVLVTELDLPWSLGDLDMSLLLETHLDDGLRGIALAEAVLFDLDRLGFRVTDGDRSWRSAPLPSEPRFVYFLQPGYELGPERGIFRERVVVDDDWLVRHGIPPGHVRHARSGPHPVPGHVRHHERSGPPGHTRQGVGAGADARALPPGQAKPRGPGAAKGKAGSPPGKVKPKPEPPGKADKGKEKGGPPPGKVKSKGKPKSKGHLAGRPGGRHETP